MKLSRRMGAMRVLLVVAAVLLAAPAAVAQQQRSTPATAPPKPAAPQTAAAASKAAAVPAAVNPNAVADTVVFDVPWNPALLRIKSYASPTAAPLQKLAALKALTPITVTDKPGITAPQSLLGLSIDLNDIEGVAHPDYINLVKHLTEFETGPMLVRVGAYSADRLTKPWPGTVYKALGALHNATGVKFILGVNQHAEDPVLTKEQVRRSEKLLPAGSVVSFAVGNEPDMYSLAPKKGLPGSLMLKPANWLNDNWLPVAAKIYGAANGATSKPRMLAGPDWSNSMMDAKKLQWWLKTVQAARPALSMVTVHHYGGDIINDKNIAGIIADARMHKKLSNVPNLVKVAKEAGLPLRISEAATLSYGGVQGISDTAGAALWSLDTAMEVAYGGGAGIHFHQVLSRENNANYNAIDYHALTERVRARHPYWGYLMLQHALEGGADIIGREINGECKVWLLRARKTGALRALVLNKVDTAECAADIKLDAAQMKKYDALADAEYMYAPGGINDRWRIYYSGAYFDEWGSSKLGKKLLAPVQRYAAVDAAGKATGGGGFVVHLTNGTVAALVSIPLAGKRVEAVMAPAAAAATAKPAAAAAAAKPAAAAAAAAAAAKPAAASKVATPQVAAPKGAVASPVAVPKGAAAVPPAVPKTAASRVPAVAPPAKP